MSVLSVIEQSYQDLVRTFYVSATPNTAEEDVMLAKGLPVVGTTMIMGGQWIKCVSLDATRHTNSMYWIVRANYEEVLYIPPG